MIHNVFMLNATIRNGKESGEGNGEDEKLDIVAVVINICLYTFKELTT